MAQDQVTFTDKVVGGVFPTDKFRAADANELKAKINANAADAESRLSNMEESNDLANERTGFENQTDSVLSKVDGTRTLTLAPAVTEFKVMSEGTVITISASQDVVWTDVEGMHYFYLDEAGTLQHTTTFDPAEYIYGTKCFTAALYWDATNKECLANSFLDERHGLTMDGVTHSYLHSNEGTRIANGLALTDILAGENGSLATHAQFGVEAGVIYDEDIRKNISAVASTTGLPVIYRDGASGDWRNGSPTAGYSVLNTGSGRLAYNEWTGATWQLTEVSNNSYVLYHVFASTLYDGTKDVFVIVGQGEYSTINAARAGAEVELTSLVTDGIPLAEFVAVATVIFQTATAKSNAVKASIELTESGDDYVDWRGSGIGSGGAISFPGDGSVVAADIDSEASTNGQVLTSNGDGTADWATPAGGGGGGLSWSTISTDTTAVAGNGYGCDTSGGAINLTLPLSPSVGDVVGAADIANMAGTNAIKIKANGSNILGSASDVFISENRRGVIMYYTGATYGWCPVSDAQAVFLLAVSKSGYTSAGSRAGGANAIQVQWFAFGTTADSTYYGDVTVARYGVVGTSSQTDGFTAGGSIGSTRQNIIDTFSFGSEVNSTDHGDLFQTRALGAGQSSSTDGYTSGGITTVVVDTIDKFSFTTSGNATDFGNLTASKRNLAGTQSSVDGYILGGTTGTIINVIEKFAFGTATDAADFGDLVGGAREFSSCCQDDSDGYVAGGDTGGTAGTNVNIIEKFAFGTNTNTTDFGDLIAQKRRGAGCSSTSDGYYAGGGNTSNTTTNDIYKYAFGTTNNATDYASLLYEVIDTGSHQG